MDSDGLCGHQQESTVRGPTGLITGNWAGEETFNTPLETLASNGAAFHRKAPPHLESVETCRMKERVSSSTSFSLQGGTTGLYIAASSNRTTASIYNCFFSFQFTDRKFAGQPCSHLLQEAGWQYHPTDGQQGQHLCMLRCNSLQSMMVLMKL